MNNFALGICIVQSLPSNFEGEFDSDGAVDWEELVLEFELIFVEVVEEGGMVGVPVAGDVFGDGFEKIDIFGVEGEDLVIFLVLLDVDGFDFAAVVLEKGIAHIEGEQLKINKYIRKIFRTKDHFSPDAACSHIHTLPSAGFHNFGIYMHKSMMFTETNNHCLM